MEQDDVWWIVTYGPYSHKMGQKRPVSNEKAWLKDYSVNVPKFHQTQPQIQSNLITAKQWNSPAT